MAGGRIERFWGLAKLGKDVVTYVLWLVSFFGWSVIVLYLSSLTPWTQNLGPLGVLFLAVLFFVVLALSYLAVAQARNIRAQAKFSEKRAAAGAINVLATSHSKEKIQLADFFSPFYRATANVRFEDCDLIGPASVFLDGGHLDGCGFIDCQVVIARDDRPVHGITRFFQCTFLRCSMFRVTLFMNYAQYQQLPPQLRAGLPMISDGRIGDI